MSISFRPAEMGDWARLFAWRNDPATQAQSNSTEPVTLEAHLKWLERTLKDQRGVHLFVAADPGRGVSVGTVRLDVRKGGEVYVSITVEPNERGHGYASAMISHAVHRARDLAGAKVLVAEVRETNHASLRAFADNAFLPRRVKDGVAVLEREVLR